MSLCPISSSSVIIRSSHLLVSLPRYESDVERRAALIREGRFFDIMAQRVGAYSGEDAIIRAWVLIRGNTVPLGLEAIKTNHSRWGAKQTKYSLFKK